ncbi:MAG: DNA polymerase III subunit delta [Prevotella sp.]|nr:DNA polymerase III subunit delta [Prevotella sp.]
MGFEQVIGQEETKGRLMQLMEEKRLPHALLFCGPAGCGKMAMAMAFASYLLTSTTDNDNARRNAEAMLAQWQHPDLHFTFPVIKPAGTSADHKMVSDDFAKEWHAMLMEGPYFSIDQWLDRMHAANQQAIIYASESDDIIRKLSLKSSQGGYKVSIIWLPERMNGECANKLLKIIEEPPQQTVFLMVSEEPEKLLETIRSRTQRIDMKKTATEAIEQALVERRGINENTAHRIARVANGNWLKALEELDAGNENRLFLDMFIMLMRLAYQRNVKELKQWSENVAAFGREKQKRMMTYFLRLVRENFMYNFQNPELVYMTQEEEDFAKNFARFINESNVMGLSELFTKIIRDIGQNANPRIVFYDMALKVIVLLRQN